MPPRRPALAALPEPDVFVGRNRELALLRGQLDGGSARAAQVVLVEGIAGVGKSSLLDQFLATVDDDGLVLRAQGVEAGRDTPYGTVADLMASVPSDSRSDRPPVVGLHQAGNDPTSVGGGLLAVLDEVQEGRGVVVVVIDDLHLADGPSTRALLFLARRLLADRVLVVCTSRPDALPPVWRPLVDGEGCHRLSLGGLADDEVAELADRVGVTLSRREVVALREVTDGHPLYARALIAQEGLDLSVPTTTGRAPPPPPPNLGRLVVTSLDRCAPATRSLVGAVAVLGRKTALSDAVWLAEVADGGAAVEEALAARLLLEVPGSDGRYVAPAHPLVHAAVYDHLGPTRRRQLHARAASISGGPARLWHRFVAAVGPDDALAAELESAADEERHRGQLAAAGEHLRQAAAVSLSGPAGQRRVLDAAVAFLLVEEAEKARSLQPQITNTAPGPYRDYVLGYLALTAGRMGEATTLFTNAWEEVVSGGEPRGPTDLPGRLAALLTIISVLDLRLDDIERWSAAALTTAEMEEPTVAFIWYARAFGRAATGHTAEALEVLRGRGAPNGVDVSVARGMLSLWSDDLHGAREEFRSAYARARSGEPLRVNQGVAFLGETEYRLGNLDEAIVTFEVAVEAMEDAGRTWDFPVVHALATYPHAARGNVEEAEHHAAAAATWAELVPVAASRAYAAGARIAVALARRDPHGLLTAARAMDAAYPGFEPGTNVFGPVLAEALVLLDRTEEADAELDRYEAQAVAVGRGSALLGVARVRGQLFAHRHEWRASLEQFAVGEELAPGLELPLESARLHATHGVALVRSGDVDRGRDRLQRAFSVLEHLGARPYAARVAAELDRLGAPPSPRRVPELTPSEAAVAGLVAEGLSNRRIASELVISVKTVEFHLSNIYRRLGITSRTHLTRILIEGQLAMRSDGSTGTTEEPEDRGRP